MKLDWLVRRSVRAMILVAGIAPFLPCALPQTPQQPAAGKITALIPIGSVGREKKTYEAKKDMELFWQDLVKTERGGRARLRLEDGSILNLGSQASLMVTKNDPGKQQTALELNYGTVPPPPTQITPPALHFEIQTNQ